MGRKKTIPDDQIFIQIRDLLRQGGDKAVSFSIVGRATGLAPATLVQRYGSRDGMVRAALIDAWDALDRETDNAMADAPMTAKGATALLKSLSEDQMNAADMGLLAADFRDLTTRARALAWREKVELALALRLGGPTKGQEIAAILFAAWQGQALWHGIGEKSFRLKDVLKRIT
jgi:AcrR family transcriptional regulator